MKKVFVGLSGGVDSSVSALLLKQEGFDVTGVFIRGWQPDWIKCTWKEDRLSALRTAAYLDIPFVTLDLEQQYKDKVVSYLLEEYKKGNTPNPDMLCNREIKFGSFLEWSLKNGADFVATGHYASTKPLDNSETKKVGLWESADKEKDQSYFLAQLTEKELKHVLFPIGHLQKSEVRRIAAKNNLPVATRKDSQGICFVGELSMSEFLTKELKPEKGNVLNTKGEIIGEHEGSVIYTIGQRHGFNIFNLSEKQNSYYVLSKDIDNNTITVTNKEIKTKENNNETFEIKNISAISNLKDIFKCKNLSARIRYRGEKCKLKVVEVNSDNNSAIFKSEKKLEFAHGQFAVFYDGDKCLGSGEL